MQAHPFIYGGLPNFYALRVPPQVLLDGNTLPVLYQGLRSAMMPPNGTMAQLLRNPFELLATYPQMRLTQQLLAAGLTQQLLAGAAAGNSAAVASALAAGTSVHATGESLECFQPALECLQPAAVL
jgi:hypothetical protein